MQPGNPSNFQVQFSNFTFQFVCEVGMLLRHAAAMFWHIRLNRFKGLPLVEIAYPSFNTALRTRFIKFNSSNVIIYRSFFNPSPFPILQRVIWNG